MIMFSGFRLLGGCFPDLEQRSLTTLATATHIHRAQAFARMHAYNLA